MFSIKHANFSIMNSDHGVFSMNICIVMETSEGDPHVSVKQLQGSDQVCRLAQTHHFNDDDDDDDTCQPIIELVSMETCIKTTM